MERDTPPSAPPRPMSPAWGLIRDKRSHQEDEEDAIASPELFRISITSGNKVTTLFLNQVSAWLLRIAGVPTFKQRRGELFPHAVCEAQ